MSNFTGNTEWLLAKIVKIENEKYKVELKNNSLSGVIFTRCSEDIRKFNVDFQINEIVEIWNYNEWVLGRILGKEGEEYIVRIESGEFCGEILRCYPNNLKKHSELEEHYEIDEIVEVINTDKITGETNWIKTKILEINRGNNYVVEIVEKCKLKGAEFNRNISNIRKFKSENNFQVGEEVQVYFYDKIEDKTEWVEAKILEIKNGIFMLKNETNILKEYYSFNLRKINSK